MKDPRMLAQLADLAFAEAHALRDPDDHADHLDRYQAPRVITVDDLDRADALDEHGHRLFRSARRHGFRGPLSRAWA